MDIISSFLSGIIPEINEKLSKECEKLKTDYIEGLYSFSDEWTKNHGGIDLLSCLGDLGSNNNLDKQCIGCINSIMQHYNKTPITFIRTSTYGYNGIFYIIIDTNFNMYYIQILPKPHPIIMYNIVWNIHIIINDKPLYSSITTSINHSDTCSVSYLQDYNIPEDCFYDTPLSNFYIDKIKQLFPFITENLDTTSSVLIKRIQKTFIELNKKSHENMLIMTKIQRMLSEKEDRLAKITTEIQEANKIITEARIKKGYKIKKCRNVSIKKYLCNFKIKHKKD